MPTLAAMAWFACVSAAAQRSAPPSPLLSLPDPSAPELTAPTVALPIVSPAGEVADSLPDAPAPQNTSKPVERQEQRSTAPGFPPVSPSPGLQLPQSPLQHPDIPSQPSVCLQNMSTSATSDLSCSRKFDVFQRFVDSTDIHPLTPRQKAILAFRNTTDPYNFATIALVSGISVASDAHSPYGPGFAGFGRNFGVAYTETAVSEFFGTFLIPAIAHQDPHYHRLPNASYSRRTQHAITQVVWAQSDYGDPMLNYSNLITTAVSDGLENLYVPGRRKDWGSAVARYSTSIATDPINNLITEFLPDVARRVNVRIVIVQRVIDKVERQN